jgi:hypothetical protein
VEGNEVPTYDTPEPITATVELIVGDVRVAASERRDTLVEVRPSDAGNDVDVRAAQDTRVEYTSGRLLVKAPKGRNWGLFTKPGSIDVTIELPAGSQVRGDAGVAAFHCTGPLAECRIKTGVGDVSIDRADRIDLHTGAGGIEVDQIAGDATVVNGSGQIRLRNVDGTAFVKNSNGDIWIGDITGDLRASTANGSITADRTAAGVSASTAAGDVRIGEIRRGSASLKTAMGEIEFGIRSGTAARLDVSTQFGKVRNEMARADGPETNGEAAEVHARTSFGDIVIRRA